MGKETKSLTEHFYARSGILAFHLSVIYNTFWASLVAQMVKKLPSMQETWVRSLGQEGPGEGNSYPPQYFAWKIPWIENPGGL